MKIPSNITREHLLQAIEKINKEGIPKDGDSQYYDVIYNGQKYPPKLMVSYANIYANGEILDRNSFEGGLNTECFKLLEGNQFTIVSKNSRNTIVHKIWVEKTKVKNQLHRMNGPKALGSALWSPRKDKKRADIYKNMREVKAGDIVLHLVDNEEFCGISLVKNEFVETHVADGTDWDGPVYLIELEKYTELKQHINKKELLTQNYHQKLTEIAKDSEVFYTKNYNLRQGAYLTPCSPELLQIINNIYFEKTSENLPFYGEFSSVGKIKTPNVSLSINKVFGDFNNSGFYVNQNVISRFICSLIAKPFVILTGLSGSGKTKLALSFAKWICETDSQYCVVSVGADWTNREPLLGFPNALESGKYIKPDNGVIDLLIEAGKKENSNKPYFLILDEMNLSHVERYFSDFLSSMESKEPITLHPESKDWKDGVPSKINLSKNLFIIGTVNIDETTYMFSPKVLDRANVIEFRVTNIEMDSFLKQPIKTDLANISRLGSTMAADFVERAMHSILNIEETNDFTSILLEFFNELKKIGAEFGYRTASEIYRFACQLNLLVKNDGDKWDFNDIIDAAIMQKILPKIHGSRSKLEPIFKTLVNFCFVKNYISSGLPVDVDNIPYNDRNKVRFPISLEKIIRMRKRVIQDGFTSFAEA